MNRKNEVRRGNGKGIGLAEMGISVADMGITSISMGINLRSPQGTVTVAVMLQNSPFCITRKSVGLPMTVILHYSIGSVYRIQVCVGLYEVC